jgi:hypothetical protein
VEVAAVAPAAASAEPATAEVRTLRREIPIDGPSFAT